MITLDPSDIFWIVTVAMMLGFVIGAAFMTIWTMFRLRSTMLDEAERLGDMLDGMSGASPEDEEWLRKNLGDYTP